MSKGCLRGIVSILSFDICGRLVVSQVAPGRAQRSFETQPVDRLIDLEIAALVRIVFLLGVTQTNPPCFAGGVNRFSSGSRQLPPRFLCDRVTISQSDYDRSPSSQRVFINVQLVVRQPLANGFFQSFAGEGARGRTSASEQRGP